MKIMISLLRTVNCQKLVLEEICGYLFANMVSQWANYNGRLRSAKFSTKKMERLRSAVQGAMNDYFLLLS